MAKTTLNALEERVSDVETEVFDIRNSQKATLKLLLSIQAKLAGHDRRFENLENRMEVLEGRMDNLEIRMETVEDILNAMSKMLTEIKARLPERPEL